MIVAAAIALAVLAGYLAVMFVFYREGKELDKKIDLTKMKRWKDDED